MTMRQDLGKSGSGIWDPEIPDFRISRISGNPGIRVWGPENVFQNRFLGPSSRISRILDPKSRSWVPKPRSGPRKPHSGGSRSQISRISDPEITKIHQNPGFGIQHPGIWIWIFLDFAKIDRFPTTDPRNPPSQKSRISVVTAAAFLINVFFGHFLVFFFTFFLLSVG